MYFYSKNHSKSILYRMLLNRVSAFALCLSIPLASDQSWASSKEILPDLSDVGASSSMPVTARYEMEDLLVAGPVLTPLDRGDDSVVPSGLEESRVNQATDSSVKAQLFEEARRHNTSAMKRMGELLEEEGNFRGAFQWFSVALGCAYIQNDEIATQDLLFDALDQMKIKIDSAIPADQKRKKKKRGAKDKAKKALRKQLKELRRDVDVLAKRRGKLPVAAGPASGVILAQNLHYFASFHKCISAASYYQFHAFIGLSSNESETLEYLCDDLRYFKNVTQNDETLLYELEQKYLQKLNSSKKYAAMGGRYYMLGRNSLGTLTPTDKLVAEQVCYDRAAVYFSLSHERKADYSLGSLFFERRVGHRLSLEDRLLQMEEAFVRSDDDVSYGKLSSAFLRAAKQDTHSKDEFLRKATIYAEKIRGKARTLQLGSAYLDSDRFEEAKAQWLQGGSGMELANVAFLYIYHKVDSQMTENERYCLAVSFYEAALKKDSTLVIARRNLARLYARLDLDIAIDKDERLKKALEHYGVIDSLPNPAEVSPDYSVVAFCWYELGDYDQANQYALQAQACGEDVDKLLDLLRELEEDSAYSEDDVPSGDSSPVVSSPRDISDKPVPAEPEPAVDELEDVVVAASSSHAVASQSSSAIQDPQEELYTLTRAERKKLKRLRKTERHRAGVIKLLMEKPFIDSSSYQEEAKRWSFSNVRNVTSSVHEDQIKLKLEKLLEDILHQPWGLKGEGQPEILKGAHKQFGVVVYSRRLTKEDRLTYVLHPETHQVHFLTWKGHYTGLDKKIRKYLAALELDQ